MLYFPFLRFHFYTSHPPCGDATIAPKRVAEASGPDPEVGPIEASGIRADQISSKSKPGDGFTGSDARLDNVFKRDHDDDGDDPVSAKRQKVVDAEDEDDVVKKLKLESDAKETVIKSNLNQVGPIISHLKTLKSK